MTFCDLFNIADIYVIQNIHPFLQSIDITFLSKYKLFHTPCLSEPLNRMHDTITCLRSNKKEQKHAQSGHINVYDTKRKQQ